MFSKQFLTTVIDRSAETPLDRRKLLTMTGLAGAGTAAAMLVPAAAASAADAPSDGSILNFALNLEYLEAEFYLRAVTGSGLGSSQISGSGTVGKVTGGRAVNFRTKAIKNYAREIAQDERAHVAFLRGALGGAKVGRPAINLRDSFTAAAQAAGVVKKGQKFDPFANETNFLLGAFLFEDVGVTAYKGAAAFLANKTYLEAAAGILAVEAYHAGIVRSTLYSEGYHASSIYQTVQKLSDARDSLDGRSNDDQGIGSKKTGNLVPTDRNSIAYSRSAGQVLNIVYLNPAPVTKGGFFPAGVNGDINTSADSR